MNIRLVITALLFFTLFSCQNDQKEDRETKKNIESIKKEKEINLNVSMLLDLSDRIDTIKYPNKTMEYYQRDLGYIESIARTFLNHLRSKKIRTIDDKIALYFNPEPKNSKINSFSEALKFESTRKTATLESFDLLEKTYETIPKKIYELALADKKYVGSDTWGFFRDKLKDYCIEDGYRNILIILTDGYMYHKDNLRKQDNLTSFVTPSVIKEQRLNTSKWEERIETQGYGLIPAQIGLENLEVLVLGIHTDSKNPYEEEIIKLYWKEWLENMGVKNIEIKSAELPSNMEKIIKNYILNE